MIRLARSIACALVATLVATAAVVTGAIAPAAAADPSQFRPSSIISDALFFDGGAMTAGDVQAFLVSKGGACTAGALCLKNYVAATTSQPAEANLCGAYPGGGVESAAAIIAKVGAVCGISQKALLVTLQKEQGLVTATSPTDSRYRIAMGFGCPDTAPCDAQYYGFFNQVYRAARQFKRYAATPQNYSYRAGRVNTILFNPNGGCGSSQVFIDNQATAGLYTYTPYQPNASALANLYGTGDGCGSYGNRNFWRDYTDWFGSTQVGANLVRTNESPTVYLVTFDRKYPIADLATMQGLAPLGGVGYVQQSFLDARTTGVTLGRFIRDRAGLIYFMDRGQIWNVADCSQLAEWGASCADYGTMALSDVQMAGFQRMGQLSFSARTVEGRWFAIYGGAKHEIADGPSAAGNAAAGTPAINIADAALDRLPYGAPLVRPAVFVRDRSTGADVFIDTTGILTVVPGLLATTSLHNATSLGFLSLDHGSMALLPAPVGALTGTFKSPSGQHYALTGGAPVALGAGQLTQLASTAPTLSSGVVAALGAPTSGTVFVRSIDSGTLYLATDSVKRPIATMEIAGALAGPAGASVTFVSAADLAKIPTGVDVLRPGTMVKSPESPQIYLVDGPRTLVPVTAFGVTESLGIGGWSTIPSATLAGYTVAPAPLSGVLACGTARYVGVGGSVAAVPTTLVDGSGVPTTVLDPGTCSTLRVSAALNPSVLFVKSTEQPYLYAASAGKKRPISTMTTAFALSSASGSMIIALVPQALLDGIPTGGEALAPATLVKTADDPTIYVVDGLSTAVPLPSFAVSDALGIRGYSVVAAATLGGYTKAAQPLNSIVACGPWRGIGSGGRLNLVANTVFDPSGSPHTPLDVSTCLALPRAAGVAYGPIFARSQSDPTLYVVQGGQKLPVATMDRAFALAAGQPFLVGIVNQAQLAALPTGPAA